MMSQVQQKEWNYLWTTLEDKDEWLFRSWIAPNTPESFAGKLVLDAGCGPGHHSKISARYAEKVVSVDLNTSEIAREKLKGLSNVEICAGDLATWNHTKKFDVIYCVGVAHHTQNPDTTIANLKELLAPGGRIILWVYSREGNGLVFWVFEPVKKYFLNFLPRSAVMAISHLLTLALYPLIHGVYRLPITGAPYYSYFKNLRGSTYQRKLLNVFDKLNAPITHLITKNQANAWLSGLTDTHLDFYVGTSWRVSGTKPKS